MRKQFSLLPIPRVAPAVAKLRSDVAGRFARVTRDVTSPALGGCSYIRRVKENQIVKVLHINPDGTALVRSPYPMDYPPMSVLQQGEFELA